MRLVEKILKENAVIKTNSTEVYFYPGYEIKCQQLQFYGDFDDSHENIVLFSQMSSENRRIVGYDPSSDLFVLDNLKIAKVISEALDLTVNEDKVVKQVKFELVNEKNDLLKMYKRSPKRFVLYFQRDEKSSKLVYDYDGSYNFRDLEALYDIRESKIYCTEDISTKTILYKTFFKSEISNFDTISQISYIPFKYSSSQLTSV